MLRYVRRGISTRLLGGHDRRLHAGCGSVFALEATAFDFSCKAHKHSFIFPDTRALASISILSYNNTAILKFLRCPHISLITPRSPPSPTSETHTSHPSPPQSPSAHQSPPTPPALHDSPSSKASRPSQHDQPSRNPGRRHRTRNPARISA